MSDYQIIVIGAGPAGLMAAGQASLLGAKTLVLEKMGRVAIKLSITGKGRCNLTNMADYSDFLSHFNPDGGFCRQAFARFFSTDLIAFINKLGVPTIVERGGRVFPESGRAGEVVASILKWAGDCGVIIRKRTPASGLLVDQGYVKGVFLNDQIITADAVVIATGGVSYPATGSTGDGYLMAESHGHYIVPIQPSLVPMETAGDIALQLSDVKLRNVGATLWIDEKKIAEAFGEVLFRPYGLAGPIILSLSRMAVKALCSNKQVYISIDLKPALSPKKLDARLRRDLDLNGKKEFHSLLKGLLPRRLIPVCISMTKISIHKASHQVTSRERKRLGQWLKDFRLEIIRFRPFSEAIVTSGGVSTKGIDPRTMGSRIVKGLFFAGEILDLDADTGGFNLQWAFSSGWLAGKSAVNFLAQR